MTTSTISGIPIDQIAKIFGKAEDHVFPTRLLYMPDEESLSVLGKAADNFGVDREVISGDILLARADAFSLYDIEIALKAGGKLIEGYSFDYPCDIIVMPYMKLTEWRANATAKTGYAIWASVAICISFLSHARAAGFEVKW